MTPTQRAAALICGCDGMTQEQAIEILALAFEQVQRDTRAEQAALLAEVREALARFADEGNWRDVCLTGDDDTDYDAMAWSPIDCEIGPDGRYSDPLFHEPWKLVRGILDLLPAPEQAPASLPSDTQMLDWLERSNSITPAEAADIVNGQRWGGKYRGSVRGAIRAAMQAESTESTQGGAE